MCACSSASSRAFGSSSLPQSPSAAQVPDFVYNIDIIIYMLSMHGLFGSPTSSRRYDIISRTLPLSSSFQYSAGLMVARIQITAHAGSIAANVAAKIVKYYTHISAHILDIICSTFSIDGFLPTVRVVDVGSPAFSRW